MLKDHYSSPICRAEEGCLENKCARMKKKSYLEGKNTIRWVESWLSDNSSRGQKHWTQKNGPGWFQTLTLTREEAKLQMRHHDGDWFGAGFYPDLRIGKNTNPYRDRWDPDVFHRFGRSLSLNGLLLRNIFQEPGVGKPPRGQTGKKRCKKSYSYSSTIS